MNKLLLLVSMCVAIHCIALEYVEIKMEQSFFGVDAIIPIDNRMVVRDIKNVLWLAQQIPVYRQQLCVFKPLFGGVLKRRIELSNTDNVKDVMSRYHTSSFVLYQLR